MAHSVATPALLCHKEPAQDTHKGLWDEMAPTRGISCLSLLLYGIRIGSEGLVTGEIRLLVTPLMMSGPAISGVITVSLHSSLMGATS